MSIFIPAADLKSKCNEFRGLPVTWEDTGDCECHRAKSRARPLTGKGWGANKLSVVTHLLSSQYQNTSSLGGVALFSKVSYKVRKVIHLRMTGG